MGIVKTATVLPEIIPVLAAVTGLSTGVPLADLNIVQEQSQLALARPPRALPGFGGYHSPAP